MMLTLVPTPIGNLEDMTARSLKALRDCAAVYCEDTRRTRQLLTHFGITKPVVRYHEHHDGGLRGLLERLKKGDDIALVSDGGLPCLSDPGRKIVALAREAGVAVTALPGANAASAAVAGSGLPGDSFVFLGFLPRSPGKRRRALTQAAALGKTLVVYESPFRVVELLTEAAETLGAAAQCCVARELSKVHEEWLRGTVAEVKASLEGRDKILGEIVVLLHPEAAPQEPLQ